MTLCIAGYYCNDGGLISPAGQCPEGYYCLEGTKTSISSVGRRLQLSECDTSTLFGDELPDEPIPCPPGTYCPTGTSSGIVDSINGPKTCSIGYYNDVCSQGLCFSCPDGYYCSETAMTTPVICPLGTFAQDTLLIMSYANQEFGQAVLKVLRAKAITVLVLQACTDQSGTADYSDMTNCTSGFYCETGTIKPIYYCPAGYSARLVLGR